MARAYPEIKMIAYAPSSLTGARPLKPDFETQKSIQVRALRTRRLELFRCAVAWP
jgi:hypothetical protein